MAGNKIIKILAIVASIIAVAVAAPIVASALGLEIGRSDGPAKPTPATTVTFDQGEWSVVTPAGWTREDITANADARKAVRYTGPDGEYFIVAIDPLGSGYSYDALWTYASKGNGFAVVAREICHGSEADGCPSGDGRFDGYVMWRTGTSPVKIGGHVWYFMFGNATKTDIDADRFEQILESVRVTA